MTPMIAFETLSAEYWAKHEADVLKSEEMYPESIRTPREEFLNILNDGGVIAKIAIVDSRYAGNIIGFFLRKEELPRFGLQDLHGGGRITYVINFVVDKAYQSKGHGTRMLTEFIKEARQKGCEIIAGHFRPPQSLHLIKKFGGEEHGTVANWENTGEDYTLCLLDIKDLQVDSGTVLTAGSIGKAMEPAILSSSPQVIPGVQQEEHDLPLLIDSGADAHGDEALHINNHHQ